MASYFGAICWHGPHHVAAKSTTISCFDLVVATTLSNSAFECMECTTPAAPEVRRLPPFPLTPRLSPAGADATGGDAAGGGAGAGGARTRDGLPGNSMRRSTRSQGPREPTGPASGAAPPRSCCRRTERTSHPIPEVTRNGCCTTELMVRTGAKT